ncbi:MAG: phage tail tip lysozyme [Clostridia bacterium]|nr:phage tail tip lysozyme [Clostridia bacterium]
MRRILLAIILILALTAALAEPVVFNTASRVFARPDINSASLAVPQGLRVELVAEQNGVAMVECNGIRAFTLRSHLSAVAPEPAPAPEADIPVDTTVAEMVIANNTRVYKTPSDSAPSIAVSAGLRVTKRAVRGDWAMVTCGSAVAYIHVADLKTYTPFVPVTGVISKNTKVYARPAANAASLNVGAGMRVTVTDVAGDWAQLANGPYVAYILVSELVTEEKWNEMNTPAATPAPAPAPAPQPQISAVEYMNSSSYSNEEKCFMFMTMELGLSPAAACGIMANIKKESSFNPKDTTGSYYGLCQWGSGRLTNMKNWCATNGYGYDTLEGQLRFMMYELVTGYSGTVLATIKNAPNTAQGAYDVGYDFCYRYERPAAKETSSVTRGNLAKDTYFPKYNK